MKVLLVAIGSLGDVHPVLGIGVALKARGHQVEMIANSAFEDGIRRAGLPFCSLGSKGEQEEELAKVGPFREQRSLLPPYEYLYLRPMKAVYRFLAESGNPSTTLVVSTWYSLGARLANELLAFPQVGLALSPGVFFSAVHPSHYSFREPPPWLPRWLYRGMFKLVESRIDRIVGPGCNQFRRELGLPPIRRVRRWLMSPDKLIGLFPSWFGPPQPDWPSNVELAGFPVFDEGRLAQTVLPQELRDFLKKGKAPVVFTPGTPGRQGRSFFQAAVEAASRLGVRAILLTKQRDQLPENLPPDIKHFDYLPFSQVLPRAAAFVHHGGIGSVAQAIRAGVPQLVAPWGIDQFDNAARVEALGVGSTVRMQTVTAAQLAYKLNGLIGVPDVLHRCARFASRVEQADALADTCRRIESIGRLRGLPV